MHHQLTAAAAHARVSRPAGSPEMGSQPCHHPSDVQAAGTFLASSSQGAPVLDGP